MEKTKKAPYHYTTIAKLAAYKQKVDRINYLQKELGMLGAKTTVTYSDMPHGSGTSDSTGDLAAKVGDRNAELLQLQTEVGLIDFAVSMLSEQKQLIIRVRYLTEGGQDKGASITLESHGRRFKWKTKNYRTYEKLRDDAIEEISGILGISTIKVQ